jgi:hypothetical protein
VSLTWGGVKQLIRLKAVARQVAVIAQESKSAADWRHDQREVSQLLGRVIDEVHEGLRSADPGLAEEFERVVIDITDPPLSLAERASIVTGWLEGAVEAEALEVQIRVGDGRQRSGKIASSAPVAD